MQCSHEARVEAHHIDTGDLSVGNTVVHHITARSFVIKGTSAKTLSIVKVRLDLRRKQYARNDTSPTCSTLILRLLIEPSAAMYIISRDSLYSADLIN